MYVKAKVFAGMKKDSIIMIKDNHFEIITKAPASGNAANARVKELVADQYQVPVSAVYIVSGHHHPSKILEVIKDE